jgi:diguanylate cyclase (GGDEF)-like protein
VERQLVEREQLVRQLVEREQLVRQLVEREQLVRQLVVVRRLGRRLVARRDVGLSLSLGRDRKARAVGDVARVWLFISVLGATSSVVWVLSLDRLDARFSTAVGVSLPWWGLAVAFYLAEALVVHLHFRKQAHTLSPSEVPLVLGLFLASPEALLVAQLVGAGLAFAVHRRQRPIKIAFNLALQSLCTGLGLLVFHALAGTEASSVQSWVAALVAAGTAHAAGVLLVSAVIAVAEGKFAAPQLGSTLTITLVGALATACLGLTAVELIAHQPLALAVLVAPCVICGLTFRSYMAQREQREQIEFLYESMRATQGQPEFGLAVGELLSALRRLLRAERAEIFLLTSTPAEPMLRSASDSAGELLMHPVELTPDVQIALEHVNASDRALLRPRRRRAHPVDALLASLRLDDGVVGALRGEKGVFGILVVGGRVGDVTTFNKNDLTLFETFASHASILLENGRLEQSLAQLTELKEKLRHQAYHDALTSLPNRLLFTDRVGDALARAAVDGTRHAVLFLDLDRFKTVNDSWGHAVGDELLVKVSERIRRNIVSGDTAARLGGDEFAVLLENIDPESAPRTAERLAASLDAPFYLSGREISVHASIGIALSGDEASTAEEVLRNADIAMYTAKGDERRRYAFYEPNLHQRLRKRRELVLELERAVERNEFEVHFQPVVSLADHSLHAFEVLVRWQHPQRGLVAANEFIGLAEETGLIRDLAASVHERAFRHAYEWGEMIPDAGDFGLWINLSPRELMEEQLVEGLADALSRASLDPRRLTLEITESSVIRDERSALRAMNRLRELGLHLSIDDFGTGYSSLSRLAEFPIEMLKVPKPFVDRLAQEQPDTSFVDAILRLAASLGLATVGEGVEHASQARTLRALGCNLGQGYLFSPPLAYDDVVSYLWASPGTAGAMPTASAHAVAV